MKKTYFYGMNAKRTKMWIALISTRSIKFFKRTRGCAEGIGINLLTKKNIGKQFIVEGLDPVQFGLVTFLGKGKKIIPFENVDELLLNGFVERYATFKKTGKNAAVFSIDIWACNITPVGKRIGNLIIEKKIGSGINAEMIVYHVQTEERWGETHELGIRKIGSVKFCSDKLWIPSRKTKNLRLAAADANKRYPNG